MAYSSSTVILQILHSTLMARYVLTWTAKSNPEFSSGLIGFRLISSALSMTHPVECGQVFCGFLDCFAGSRIHPIACPCAPLFAPHTGEHHPIHHFTLCRRGHLYGTRAKIESGAGLDGKNRTGLDFTIFGVMTIWMSRSAMNFTTKPSYWLSVHHEAPY